jgi:two-component system response regulator FlrC
VLQPQESPQSPSTAPSCLDSEQDVEAIGRALVGRTLADVERSLILDTLASCQGNRTHAARILGISIRTLRNKLNEYAEIGITVPEPGQKSALS